MRDRQTKRVFPILGDMAIDAITAPKVKEVLKALEGQGIIDTAHDIRQRLEAIFRYAKAAGLRPDNPAADMRDVLKPIPTATPRPAVVTLPEARQVLFNAEAVPAFPVTHLALRLLALTAQRPGEVRRAEWTEFGRGRMFLSCS